MKMKMKETLGNLYNNATLKLKELNSHAEKLAIENPKSGFLIAVLVGTCVAALAIGLVVPTIELLVQWLTMTALVISRLAGLTLAGIVFALTYNALFAVVTKSLTKPSAQPAPTATTPPPAESSTSPS